MKNNATRTIRSEEITIDVRICAALAVNRGGEIYLAAIAPDMELTVITLDEAPGILPCFEEDDACLNLPNTSLLLCYNPAQVLKMGGKHYLTGPVILVRTNMDGEVISLTIDEVYLFQKYLASHSMWNCSLRRKRTPSKSSRSDKTVPENFAAYPAGFSGSFLLIAQSVLGTTFPAVSICLATIFSNSPVIVAQFATR